MVNNASYNGILPWQYATKVDGLLTRAEILTQAGLDWGVIKEPLVAHLSNGMDMRVRGKFTTRRDDNHEVLGIVGKNFRPVTQQELTALLDAFAEEMKAKFEYAGMIGMGERVWFGAKLPKEIKVKNSDEVIEYRFVLSNAHNGSKCIEMHLTPVLQRNNSILNIHTGISESFAIRHTARYDEHIRETRRVFSLSEKYFDSIGDVFNNLADIKVGKDKFIEVLDGLMPLPTDPEANTNKVDSARDRLASLYTTENAANPFPDTAWSVFCTVANYADNFKSFKSRKGEEGSKEQIRFLSILEGDSQNLKNNALDILLAQ